MPIQCINVTKKYGNQTVLNDITVSFEDRKIHGLVGRNGSGKINKIYIRILIFI